MPRWTEKGALRLRLVPDDYPKCVRHDCMVRNCEMYLPVGPSRCAIAVANASDWDTADIVQFTGMSERNVEFALQTAKAKLGPLLAPIVGARVPAEGERPCKICGDMFVSDEPRARICPGECQDEARRRRSAAHYERNRSAA